MATTVNYVGNQYSIPSYQDRGYAQGNGNLSSYLVALATGSLTLGGGSFSLTADVNFGANFGLLAVYFKSRSSNIATAGVFRLANLEQVNWRNASNGGNCTLGVDASDRLAYTGGDVILDPGKCVVLRSPDGTKSIRFGLDNNGNFGEM
jgi:hypothetical protein